MEWDEVFTPVDSGEESTFSTYEFALSAAGGDPNRVWTVVDGDYPDGEKIWRFNFYGEEKIVLTSSPP